MKIINIAYYTFKRNFRNKKTLINMLLVPIVLMLILGNALGSFYTTKNIDKTNVGYLNRDSGKLSKHFDEFLENSQIKELLNIKKISDMDEGKKLLSDKKISAIIFIDENYSKQIENAGKGIINVYGRQYADFRLSIVQSIVESYNNGANTTSAMLRAGSQNAVYKGEKNITEVPVSADGNRPGSMDYYVVTMLVMIIMYAAHYGSYAIGELYYDSLGARIKSAPLKSVESLLGIVIGTFITVFMQILILVLFTKFVYKANWGGNIGLVLFIAMSLAVLSITLGGMLSVILGDDNKASSIISILIPIFTFISGGYAQIVTESPVFTRIMYLSPNYLAQNAIFNTIYGGPISLNVQYMGTNGCIAAMWIATAIMIIITVYTGRRRLS